MSADGASGFALWGVGAGQSGDAVRRCALSFVHALSFFPVECCGGSQRQAVLDHVLAVEVEVLHLHLLAVSAV